MRLVSFTTRPLSHSTFLAAISRGSQRLARLKLMKIDTPQKARRAAQVSFHSCVFICGPRILQLGITSNYSYS